ncbi:MAG TPA: hypothetical protein VKO18_07580 [Terriglobia bacterium]|nr:hypothetical protein [Terriglobia bacterium]
MKTRTLLAVLVAGVALPWAVAAKEKKPTAEPEPPAPIGWLDLQAGSHSFSVSMGDLQKASRSLARGALLPVFKTKEKHGAKFAQLRALNLETGKSELGWVEINSSDLKPPESYPLDSELLRLLGAPYLEDFTAEHTGIARFLVRQAQSPPALLCYVVTMPLSMAKLVIFTASQGKYLPGAALNIPISEMNAGITSLEARDLLGDGSDCVITKEPFREQAQTYGANLRIRKIAGGQFQVVWQAPIEFHNLSQYSSKMQILQPPERNIGAPGTVTTGEVTFRPNGKGQEPVWKGKVEFFVFGRDRAVDAVNIEKACPWDGKEFASLR